MDQARHAKLRAAGWRYDPISERYSAPGVLQDGEQKMHTQAEAWATYEKAAKADERRIQEQPAENSR